MNLKLAALIGAALAVMLGAFGAHGLKPLLSDYQQSIWDKAVLYQFIHALALLLLSREPGNTTLRYAGWLFLAGIVCFCGSLYLLATAHLMWVNVSVVGPVTPVGGVCFVMGWLLWAWGTVKGQ